MTDLKISKESAEDLFNEILEYYDLEEDDDGEGITEKVINSIQPKLVKAFQRGYLETEMQEGRLFIVQNLRCEVKKIDSPLRYKPLNGRARMAMKGKEKANNFARMYQLLSSLAGVDAAAFANIEGPDLGLAENLASLFLLV